MNHYGVNTPPLYDATKVLAPVISFWGDNDWLADPVVSYQTKILNSITLKKDQQRFVSYQDVAWAEAQFPNLKESVHIAQFNHLDFLWALEVKELVNDVILANMPIKPQL